jgi:uncharacterized integral membrane protein
MTMLVIALVFGTAGAVLLWVTTGKAQLLGVAILAAALTVLMLWINSKSTHLSYLPTHESHPPQMTSRLHSSVMGGETLS